MIAESKQKSKVEIALAYRNIGWSVIPVRPDSKVPYIKWKPYQKRPPTEKEIRRWFGEDFPEANIGIVTGKVSNLVVIDVDSHEALENLRMNYNLPDTIMQTTGRNNGGWQFFFKYPDGHNIKTRAGVIKDVDVKGEGGFVVVPPSIHNSGRKYRWGI